MPKASTENDKVLQRLDRIIRLLQDLFILEGVKANMKKEELRNILGVDKNRIGRISKHVVKPPAST